MTTKDIEVSHKILKEQDVLNAIRDGGQLSNEERDLLVKIGAIDSGDQVALVEIQGLKGIIEIKS